MRIGIRSLLLLILMPMVVVPLAIIGAVVVVQTGTFTSEARRVVDGLDELQELARNEFATLSVDLNRRQSEEGRIMAQRLGRALQVRIDELRRIAEVLGPSPVVTAYVTAEVQSRSLLNRQTNSFLDGIVDTYNLSTIALLNPDGQEMLWRGRIIVPEGGDPLFDGEMLNNASEDESESIWWSKALAAREVVVTTHPCFDTPSQPMAIGISLPLRYRAGAYAPRGGQLAGVLHLSVPLPELLANLIGDDGAARLESEDGSLLAAHGDIGNEAEVVAIRAGESVAGMIPVLLIDGSQLAASLARLGRLTEGLDQRIHGAGEAAARVSEGAEALTSTVLWVLLAASVLGVIAALGVANRLAKPIIRLSESAEGLRRGRADVIHVNARMREIAVLQQAMAGLAQQLQEKAAYAQRVADGDLSVAQVAASDEDQLGLSLESMGRGLNDLIANISEANQEVDLVVEDLSQAAQTVADGACRQASALEQVSASMQEIGARAKTSASNAATAATDAGQVRKAANDSGDRVQAMLAAMQRIQQAASRTMGVIKVIQDIAFQTNLLALNAAVEAARAGHHGKGFSVVAGEVRNLAARSAAAAKETSELLEAAVSAVGDGQTIAKQTAESIDGIIKRISGVGDAVEILASEAGEQSAAVNQVAEGLQHINTVTIDTAAQADRAREASERLAQEAGRLRQDINRFQLDGTAPPALPAPVGARIETREA